MYTETNLTIKFNTTSAANIAKEIARKAILTIKDDDYGYRNAVQIAADNLTVENETLTIPEEHLAFRTEYWMDIAPIIIKAIAENLQNGSFTFESYSSNCYSELEMDGKYKDGTLEINSTYYPEGYTESVYCPECGEDVVTFDEYEPNKTYICPHCGEEVDLSREYENSKPVIEKETIKIK